MLFKDKNLPFGAPQRLEFRNFPYVFHIIINNKTKILLPQVADFDYLV